MDGVEAFSLSCSEKAPKEAQRWSLESVLSCSGVQIGFTSKEFVALVILGLNLVHRWRP